MGAVIIAFLWSGVKYLIGAALCLVSFSNPILGFSVCTAGAATGIFVFTYGGFWIETKIKEKFMRNGKKFSKRTRNMIRIKHSGGLPLVALLTPILFSIPVGCILATTFIHSRHKIVLYQILAAVFWGVIIFGAQWIFHFNLADKLRFW